MRNGNNFFSRVASQISQNALRAMGDMYSKQTNSESNKKSPTMAARAPNEVMLPPSRSTGAMSAHGSHAISSGISPRKSMVASNITLNYCKETSIVPVFPDQPLSSCLDYVPNEWEIHPGQVNYFRGGDRIKGTDTPASLKLNEADVVKLVKTNTRLLPLHKRKACSSAVSDVRKKQKVSKTTTQVTAPLKKRPVVPSAAPVAKPPASSCRDPKPKSSDEEPAAPVPLHPVPVASPVAKPTASSCRDPKLKSPDEQAVSATIVGENFKHLALGRGDIPQDMPLDLDEGDDDTITEVDSNPSFVDDDDGNGEFTVLDEEKRLPKTNLPKKRATLALVAPGGPMMLAGMDSAPAPVTAAAPAPSPAAPAVTEARATPTAASLSPIPDPTNAATPSDPAPAPAPGSADAGAELTTYAKPASTKDECITYEEKAASTEARLVARIAREMAEEERQRNISEESREAAYIGIATNLNKSIPRRGRRITPELVRDCVAGRTIDIGNGTSVAMKDEGKTKYRPDEYLAYHHMWAVVKAMNPGVEYCKSSRDYIKQRFRTAGATRARKSTIMKQNGDITFTRGRGSCLVHAACNAAGQFGVTLPHEEASEAMKGLVEKGDPSFDSMIHYMHNNNFTVTKQNIVNNNKRTLLKLPDGIYILEVKLEFDNNRGTRKHALVYNAGTRQFSDKSDIVVTLDASESAERIHAMSKTAAVKFSNKIFDAVLNMEKLGLQKYAHLDTVYKVERQG